MLNWKEISIQNKKMSTYGFLKFLKEADVLPNMIGIEQIEDIIIRMLVIFISEAVKRAIIYTI